MVDGTYRVTVRVPFSPVRGTAVLEAEGSQLRASVDAGGMTLSAVGTVAGDSFSFAGEEATPMGRLAYQISGTVKGDALTAFCKTRLGTFRVTGTRER